MKATETLVQTVDGGGVVGWYNESARIVNQLWSTTTMSCWAFQIMCLGVCKQFSWEPSPRWETSEVAGLHWNLP